MINGEIGIQNDKVEADVAFNTMATADHRGNIFGSHKTVQKKKTDPTQPSPAQLTTFVCFISFELTDLLLHILLGV